MMRDVPTANPALRVVLMSATVNADQFCAPTTSSSRLPLEDAIEVSGYVARGKRFRPPTCHAFCAQR